jgi:hypothetical protein
VLVQVAAEVGVGQGHAFQPIRAARRASSVMAFLHVMPFAF